MRYTFKLAKRVKTNLESIMLTLNTNTDMPWSSLTNLNLRGCGNRVIVKNDSTVAAEGPMPEGDGPSAAALLTRYARICIY